MMRRPRTVLVVDDDQLLCDVVEDHARGQGVTVVSAHTAAEALQLCARQRVDAVLLDQRLPDGDGASLCPKLLELNEDTKIIFITAFPSFENAVSAIRGGAFDYLPKPFDLDALDLALSRALRTLDLEQVAALREFEQERDIKGAVLVGAAGGLAPIAAQIRAASAAAAPLLITGETGTGKNVVARRVHDSGPLRHAPFVTINCAALPESLIEAELFGHERGAFTGAHVARKGIFEMAEGGTLLLDEIGEMDHHLQAKLLGVLDGKTFKRVGGDTIRTVDVRVIASTAVDLEDAVARRAFREDLYYRLSVIRIHVPPLRERRQDIGALCHHCIAELAGNRRAHLPDSEVALLAAYDWPGNVRELRNVLERAILLSSSESIAPSRLLDGPRLHPRFAPSAPLTGGTEPPLPTLAEVERRHIEVALRRCAGNRAQAARALGISLSTLKRRLRELGPR